MPLPDPHDVTPLLRTLTPTVRIEAYSVKAVKAMLLSQYAADLAMIEQQIGTLLEQRSRLQSLQSFVKQMQCDLIEALMQERKI